MFFTIQPEWYLDEPACGGGQETDAVESNRDPDRPTRAAQIEVLHQCSHPKVLLANVCAMRGGRLQHALMRLMRLI